MPYKITVTVTATIERVKGPETTQPVGQVTHSVVRTNGAPSETYAVHEVEEAGAEAVEMAVKMVEAGYGRSSRPSWECS